jgi:hypothetical protein
LRIARCRCRRLTPNAFSCWATPDADCSRSRRAGRRATIRSRGRSRASRRRPRRRSPDLVIHVGDYHYREDPCPLGNAGCAGSPWGYGWDVWDADFFTPGAPLLAAAPWIVIRGNHEACGRAGQGWYRFLDPRPLAPLGTCDDPANDETADYTATYAVPLGAAGQRARHASS